MTKLLAAAGAG